MVKFTYFNLQGKYGDFAYTGFCKLRAKMCSFKPLNYYTPMQDNVRPHDRMNQENILKKYCRLGYSVGSEILGMLM